MAAAALLAATCIASSAQTYLPAKGDMDDMAVMLFRNPGDEYVLVAVSTGKGTEGRKWNEPRPRLSVDYAGE